jgi:hypothetical protein
MPELIHESSTRIISRGDAYRAQVVGEQQQDGSWQGWIEYHPLGSGSVLATGRETTQVSRGALEYWASGLESTYFEGAFERAGTLAGR